MVAAGSMLRKGLCGTLSWKSRYATRSTEIQDVDRSLRGEGQCLTCSAQHDGDTGRKLGSQLQMADRESVKGEKGDFWTLEGDRRA